MNDNDIPAGQQSGRPLGLGSSEGLGAASEAREKYAPGTPCTANTSGDVFMMAEARIFFGVPCVVVKRTKAGLILVARHGNLKTTYSFPQRNVDVLEAPNGMLAGLLPGKSG